MKKAQELSMNLIVVGALALTVLLIVGGMVIFGPWDMLGSFTSSDDSSQQLLMTKCSSKCTNLKYYASDPADLTDDELKTYCCEYVDLNGDQLVDVNELCADAYNCKLNGKIVHCSGTKEGVDFSFNDGVSCGLATE